MKRVLVVEDSQEVRDLITHLLARVSDCKVSSVGNGAEAIACATRQAPDVIITDVDLPGIDGVELIRRVRSAPILLDVPIIVITAGIRGPAALAAGGNTLIEKPFSVAHLLSLVKSLL